MILRLTDNNISQFFIDTTYGCYPKSDYSKSLCISLGYNNLLLAPLRISFD